MSELSSFVIDFYVTYNNGSAVTTVVNQPILPTKSNVTTTIEYLIAYVEANGITFQNYSMVSDGVNSIPVPTTSMEDDGTGYTELMNKIKSSISSKETLIKYLQELLTKIKAEGSTMDVTTPDMETTSGTKTSIVGNLRSRRTGGSSVVTKPETLGAKVSTLQTDSSKLYTSLSKFIGAVKNTFNSMNSDQPHSTPMNTITTSMNTGTVSGRTGATPNNIIDNIAKTLVGGRTPGMAPRRGPRNGNVQKPANMTSINTFPIPVPTLTSSTTVTSQPTNYYEVSTSVSNGYINVLYSYYLANTTTSAYAFTFSLSPKSLISLSYSGYSKAISLSSTAKTNIIDHSCYSGSTDNTGIWTSYLIWLYSYLSIGVASQFGLNGINPFPEEEQGSVNYMLDFDYMQKVGNFSLTLQKSTLSSDSADMLDIGIPYIWPRLMYSFDNLKKYGSQDGYMAETIVNTIKTYTS